EQVDRRASRPGLPRFIHSHIHYETHDFSASLSVHFVESGDGGGMKKDFASTIPDSRLNTSRRSGPTRATSRVLNGDLERLYKK
ncbi:hypothetical protein PR003_g34664, partial [Phytophthora rubi]